MEVDTRERPSPVSGAQPPTEQRAGPEVRRAEDFHRQLASPHEFDYQTLPQEIWLEEKWHALMRRIVAATAQQGREYSVEVACIDRDGPLLSQPFEIDLFFQDQWGEDGSPIFISHMGVGTESAVEACSIPATIEWHGEVVPLRRVGGIHTHPNNTPFSDDDMLWFTTPGTDMKLTMVASTSFVYLLLRTAAEPADAYAYLQAHQGKYSWREQLQFQFQPHRMILTRNQTLARYCKFGLYQGQPGGPLMRLA